MISQSDILHLCSCLCLRFQFVKHPFGFYGRGPGATGGGGNRDRGRGCPRSQPSICVVFYFLSPHAWGNAWTNSGNHSNLNFLNFKLENELLIEKEWHPWSGSHFWGTIDFLWHVKLNSIEKPFQPQGSGDFLHTLLLHKKCLMSSLQQQR